MTTQELISYYADLLIIQYRKKPKAYAMVKALVTGMIMDQVQFDVLDAYNIETAIGTQLDTLGKYAGVVRRVDTLTGSVTLNDSDFRVLVKMKLIRNNMNSSLKDIQQLLSQFFAGEILVFDYADMAMSYYFNAALGSQNLAEAFVKQGLLPRPMGVQLATLVYVANVTNIFSFADHKFGQQAGTAGFNTHLSYQGDLTHRLRPWLAHTDGISL